MAVYTVKMDWGSLKIFFNTRNKFFYQYFQVSVRQTRSRNPSATSSESLSKRPFAKSSPRGSLAFRIWKGWNAERSRASQRATENDERSRNASRKLKDMKIMLEIIKLGRTASFSSKSGFYFWEDAFISLFIYWTFCFDQKKTKVLCNEPVCYDKDKYQALILPKPFMHDVFFFRCVFGTFFKSLFRTFLKKNGIKRSKLLAKNLKNKCQIEEPKQ